MQGVHGLQAEARHAVFDQIGAHHAFGDPLQPAALGLEVGLQTLQLLIADGWRDIAAALGDRGIDNAGALVVIPALSHFLLKKAP